MSVASLLRRLRSFAVWTSATAGAALATATAAFPGGVSLPGTSPDHLPAVLAVLVLPLGLRVANTALLRHADGAAPLAALARRSAAQPRSARVAAVLLLVGAVVHLALLPGHLAIERQTGILFALDAAGFLGAAALALTVRRWRIPAGVVALLTVVAYAYYVRTGLEDGDAVGILTCAVELAVIPVALAGWVAASWQGPGRRVLAIGVAAVLALLTTTTVARAVEGRSSLAAAMGTMMPAPDAGSTMGGAADPGVMNGPAGGASMGTAGAVPASGGACPGVAAMPTSDGMLMQPVPSTPPTAAEVQATNQLIAATTAGIAKYASIDTAITAGYKPTTPVSKPVVHMLNRRNFSDNPLANPAAPQSLVYAHRGSTWVLLGAMFLTNGTCKEGPDIGGSLTDWHAHVNLCFTAAGIVSGSHPDAAGACPAGQVNHATPFMLHVYTVANNPSGPFEISRSAIVSALSG